MASASSHVALRGTNALFATGVHQRKARFPFSQLRNTVPSRSGARSSKRFVCRAQVDFEKKTENEGTPKSEEGQETKLRQEKSSSSALSSLDAYFGKLEEKSGRAADSSASSSSPPASTNVTSAAAAATPPVAAAVAAAATGAAEASVEAEKKTEGKPITRDVAALKSLDAYFDLLNPPPPPAPEVESPPPQPKAAATAVEGTSSSSKEKGTEATKDELPEGAKMNQKEMEEIIKRFMEESKKAGGNEKDVVFEFNFQPDKFQTWLTERGEKMETSPLSFLIAFNAAIFLFELASPEAVPGLIVTSLPSIYLAKVNDLILAGDWWRLITPMFLHAGFLHIIAGSLCLTFVGPAVEAAFGPLGFLLAYLSGGIFGNLFSFLNTSDVTVGGTGPLYGILGAFVWYLYKNREAVGKEQADDVMRRLIIFGSLNIALGNPLPIDDWTHIGGALGGLLFGALASPKVIPVMKDGKTVDTFLSEEPDNKQLAWIFLLCIGIFVALYEVSSPAMLEQLVNSSIDPTMFRDRV